MVGSGNVSLSYRLGFPLSVLQRATFNLTTAQSVSLLFVNRCNAVPFYLTHLRRLWFLIYGKCMRVLVLWSVPHENMCRIAIVDIYGMTSFNTRVLKQMLHAKEEQEAALNVPCTKWTLLAVNCVYTTHLSESVQERETRKKLLNLWVARKRKTHSKLHFQGKEFCKIPQRFNVVDKI